MGYETLADDGWVKLSDRGSHGNLCFQYDGPFGKFVEVNVGGIDPLLESRRREVTIVSDTYTAEASPWRRTITWLEKSIRPHLKSGLFAVGAGYDVTQNQSLFVVTLTHSHLRSRYHAGDVALRLGTALEEVLVSYGLALLSLSSSSRQDGLLEDMNRRNQDLPGLVRLAG